MKSRPTPAQLRTAAQWLAAYPRGDDVAPDLRAVSAWLCEQADAMALRQAARAAGVPVAVARQLVRNKRLTIAQR